MRFLRGLVLTILIYSLMAVLGIIGLPFAAMSSQNARRIMKLYCRIVFWLARFICGIRLEVRGDIPHGNVLVLSKHQSFLDVMLHMYHLPAPRFVMKQSLVYAPMLGFYARRIGCVPVARGKSGAASQMLREFERGIDGQVLIYPQGTRVPPGQSRPYKIGAALLYEQIGEPAVLAATNTGVFWPARGIAKRPGLAVLEFFDRLPAGLGREEFMRRAEEGIETRSLALLEPQPRTP